MASDDTVTRLILEKLDDIEKRVAAIEKKHAWIMGIIATVTFLATTLGQKLYAFVSTGIK